MKSKTGCRIVGKYGNDVNADQHYFDLVFRRIAQIGVIRELQANRQTDIVSIRQKLGLQCGEPIISAVFTTMAKIGALEGEKIGIDPANGYPYKRWSIIDPDKAKLFAKRMNIRIMPPDGVRNISAITPA